jgi:hypothetical protein
VAALAKVFGGLCLAAAVVLALVVAWGFIGDDWGTVGGDGSPSALLPFVVLASLVVLLATVGAGVYVVGEMAERVNLRWALEAEARIAARAEERRRSRSTSD